MSDFWKSVLTAFGMAAKDASPEELDTMVATTAAALDAAPAEPMKDAAPEAEPADKAEDAAEPAKDAAAPAVSLDERMNRLEAMLAQLMPKGPESKLHDESDLDEMVEKLAGKKADPEAAVTVPAEKMEDSSCMSPAAKDAAKDAAVELLKKVRPAVAAIKDKNERARVVDALLSTVQGHNTVGDIMQAAQDSARANSEASRRTAYEKACAEAENAYAARNPHKNKEA